MKTITSDNGDAVTFIDLFEEQAARYPQHIALETEGSYISYEALHLKSARLACYLKQQGVGKEKVVALSMEQGIDRVIVMLAILKADAAYVFLDPEYPEQRLQRLVALTTPVLLVTNTALAGNFQHIGIDTIYIDDAIHSSQIAASTPVLNRENDPAQLAYVVFTSGSTGMPKATTVEHQAVLNFVRHFSLIQTINPGSRVLQFNTPAFDGIFIDLWWPLCHGAAVILYPDSRVVGAALIDFIRKKQITQVPYLTPSVLSTIADEEDIGRLRKICIGGEKPDQQLVRRWRKKVSLVNIYGPTETAVVVCGFPFDEAFPLLTIGKPFPGVQFYVLDEQLRQVVPGQSGELYIGGIQMARGYLHEPVLTAASFISYSFPGVGDRQNGTLRLYKTGDMVRQLEDGNFEYIGRTDNQIKIRGFRIETDEIENAIHLSGKVVTNAVVMKGDVPDSRRLVCYYVPDDDQVRKKAVLIEEEHEKNLLTRETVLLTGEENEIIFPENTFPGISYLMNAIVRAMIALKGKGRIKLAALHDYRQLYRQKEAALAAEVADGTPQRIIAWLTEQSLLQEERLFVSPDFFYHLAVENPVITNVSIDPLSGEGYRYSVSLDLNGYPGYLIRPSSGAQQFNDPIYNLALALLGKEIQAGLRQLLPAYMVPDLFIPVSRFYMTDNGKADKAFLSNAWLTSTFIMADYLAPETETEKKLAVAWSKILNRNKIGVHENFFHVGGNSLLAAKLTAMIRHELRLECTVSDIFNFPTIRQLALSCTTREFSVALLPEITKKGSQAAVLSFQQQWLWFIDRLQGSINYHIPVVFDLNHLSCTRREIAEVLRGLLLKHEAYRTVVREEEGEPYQMVIAADDWQLAYLDEEPRPDLLVALTNQPFDLSRDYMLRAFLLQRTLLVVVHHIASDGWTHTLLEDELDVLYGGSAIPAPALQYIDYALWQRQHANELRVQQQTAYWKQKLRDVEQLKLPLDFPRPATNSMKGARFFLQLDRQLTDALVSFSMHQEVSLYMTLLAVFHVLMARYSGQRDICIGTPVANRPLHELETSSGYFVNMLAIREDLSGNPSFTDFLRQVKQTVLEAFQHQEAPFGKVVEALQQKRDTRLHPLFQSVFILQNSLRPKNRRGTLISNNTSKFDIQFEVTEVSSGLELVVEYCTDLFKPDTIARMAGHYLQLLSAILQDASVHVYDIDMLTAAEKEILLSFNGKQVRYPDKTVVEMIEERAYSMPEQIAVVAGDAATTYRELNEKANQLAWYLIQTGVEREAIIACCLLPSVTRLWCMLGILKAGCAYTVLEPHLPTERINYILKDVAAPLVLMMPGMEKRITTAATIVVPDDEVLIGSQPVHNPVNRHSMHNLMYVIYTSGTTSQPKGVLVEHRSVNNFICNYTELLGIGSDDQALQFSTPAFDGSVIDLWIPLTRGATLHLYPNNRILGNALYDFIIEHKISIIPFIPPPVLSTLPAGASYPALHTVGTGGEECPEYLMRQWAGKVRLFNMYGPTEGCVAVNYHQHDGLLPANTLGRAASNVALQVLDEYRKPVPIGVYGELYIGGVQVTRGYLNKPEVTAEKYVIHEGQRMYRTGDMVRYLSSGLLEFGGRKDRQLKIRGYRIELAEVEGAIIQQPGVEQVVVTPVTNAENDSLLAAYLVYKTPESLSALKAAIQELLPHYMMPEQFIIVDKIPINENGKIAFDRLSRYEAAPPEVTIAYNSEPENTLFSIWQQLLGRKDILPEDNFFDLGGHSLLLVKAFNKLPEDLRKRITIRELYEHPSIGDLAAYLRQERNDEELQKSDEERQQLLWQDAAIGDLVIEEVPLTDADPANPRHILLTGATGFVGIHLLKELLDQTHAVIHLLIRGENEETIRSHLSNVAAQQQLPAGMVDCSRVRIVCGDLSQPLLGLTAEKFSELAQTIDMIYHSGSAVNFVKPYTELKGPNVTGMRSLLKLAATGKRKYFSLLSSVAVFGWGYHFTGKTVCMERDTASDSLPYITRDMGYVQSKWVMDQLAQAAVKKGIPVVIFRLGYVLCHSETGVTARNQWWSRIVKTCICLKAYPDLEEQREEFVTVDFVCNAVVHISKKREAIGQTFAISAEGEANITLSEFFESLNTHFGYGIRKTPYREWLKLWESAEDIALYPLLSLFKDEVFDKKSIIEMYQHTPDFDTTNTRCLLADSDLRLPDIKNREMLLKYLRYIGA